jgi:ATP-dependent Clp protease ATP-binding subunit ClpA
VTEQVRNLVEAAYEEAVRLGGEAAGPQHIFLALTHKPDGVLTTVLNEIPVELEQLRANLEDVTYEGEEVVEGGRSPMYGRPLARLSWR